jgi:acetylornithine deacetylase/succinyl-diaminopimelate desuccinylase-like protein
MRIVCALLSVLVAATAIPASGAEDNRSLSDRTRQYLSELVRIDTSNPPGSETQVAQYLKQTVEAFGISGELLGGDPKRLNFVARLRGNGKGRPLLLIAHSDVVPADKQSWTVNPFGAEVRNGIMYGRGTLDAKSLLAAETAVMVEIKRRNLRLGRDLILVSEADEEGGSTGIQWLVQNAWPKIDAEFALNEGGSIFDTKDGTRVFQIQTQEKLPMRLVLTARGTAGHGSVPRADNPIEHLSEAISRLSKAEQPIHLNGTTRRYFRGLSRLPDYDWLGPLIPRLDNPATARDAAAQIRAHDAELDVMVHTTVTPTVLPGTGNNPNVIPNTATAQIDVRRLPSEAREDVLARLRQIVNDNAVEISFAAGPQAPTAETSSPMTTLYRAMERVIARIYPHDAVVLPFMSRGATDSNYLRSRGMPVYGAPLILREPGESRVHGNDERILLKSLDEGVELLWQIVLETAGEN